MKWRHSATQSKWTLIWRPTKTITFKCRTEGSLSHVWLWVQPQIQENNLFLVRQKKANRTSSSHNFFRRKWRWQTNKGTNLCYCTQKFVITETKRKNTESDVTLFFFIFKHFKHNKHNILFNSLTWLGWYIGIGNSIYPKCPATYKLLTFYT